MQQIATKEKDTYQLLLEYLTDLIREHSSGTTSLRQQENPSPLKEFVEQAKATIAESEHLTTNASKILIIIVPDNYQKVLDAFLPYVAPEQKEALVKLFTTGDSSEAIYFKGSNIQLGDFFRRLKDKGMLLGISRYTELADWLSQHFFFKNKDKGSFTPVSMKSIKKVLQQGDTPKKNAIKF
jgi:hypothetical protein